MAHNPPTPIISPRRACIFGATGGIGAACVDQLSAVANMKRVYAGARRPKDYGMAKITPFAFDLRDENSIRDAAQDIGADGPIDLVIIATGILSAPEQQLAPEKSWSAQSVQGYENAFAINTIGPALIGKYFLPLLAKDQRSVFAVVSARVGSVSDNHLGGWHAYRASKAALNMVVRNFANELSHRNKKAIAVALHPGTVDTKLSEPFQSNVAAAKLFTPQFAATNMLHVLSGLTQQDSGGFFAWDGTQIAF